jgi:hypothetical protein
MARYQIKNFPSDLLWPRICLKTFLYTLEAEGQASMKGADEGGAQKISCVIPKHRCFTGRWHPRLAVDDQTVNVCVCAVL